MADDAKKTATPATKTATDPQPTKSPAALREEKTLEFWTRERIFHQLVDREAPKGDYVFYDGPPFATGLPHFGHVLPTSIKDAIPRYKTMQGYRVRRRWGWDCHGLPVENLIEKELGLKVKKDIVDYGIGRFNEAARAVVLRYEHEWRRIIPRLGRWVDMDNDYETMDPTYTESVWWAFKTLHEKGLVYEGFKSMQICPRCETTLANFEVNQGYRDITDISVYVKFELADEPGTYLLAWTTTPWTLPGNVALAVNPEAEYTKMTLEDGSNLIFASARPRKIPGFEKVIGVSLENKEDVNKVSLRGSDLVGKSYKPVFDYYAADPKLKNRQDNWQNGWKVYAADFVATDEGTGIVHIAPAFGADDMEFGKKHDLPFIQHVGMDGKFKKEVTDFAGQSVKPKDGTIMSADGKPDKDAHQSGDVAIIKYLAATHTLTYGGQESVQTSPALFAKEKIIHPYAHCWRCETPLLNYAASSWFVRVPEIKDRLVSENKKVAWVPEEVGLGRFGNWLLGARDWAISRSRFWGAPLPVWRTVEEEKDAKDSRAETINEPKTIFIGSLSDLKKYSHAKNTYFILRHGQAENNTKRVISSSAGTQHHLTETGKTQVKEAAAWLAGKKIDLIYVSPFIRTQETAAIIAECIDISADKIITEPAIGELQAGEYDGMDFNDFISKFPFEKRFEIRPPSGENYSDVKRRTGDFLYSLEKKHSSKRILIVTHDSPAFLLTAAAAGLSRQATVALRGTAEHFILNAKPFELKFAPLPHNADYELDLHRPYIDEVELSVGSGGQRLVRIPEVFDCWFESGSMPFAEAHYPFEKNSKRLFQPKKGFFKKTAGYPADFIAEGQDQTRGWFYSLLVLGTALFGCTPYKNVIVNGLVLAEDGQKMSKSKGNFPDLMPTVDRYGADALRFYLLSSPLVRAQEFCFAERGVDEVAKKHIGRLTNVVSFYEMYANETKNVKENINTDNSNGGKNSAISFSAPKSTHVLDRWIMARLSELFALVTQGLEDYELDRAARPFADFIDDLSTWYIRRSRDRFKCGDEKDTALSVTKYILVEMAKLLAPFMPFLAEDIYQRVNGLIENGEGHDAATKSVHLESWPSLSAIGKNDRDILDHMSEVRRIASLALEARMKAKINVRQPLSKLVVASGLFELQKNRPAGVHDGQAKLYADLISLIKEEINVKEIIIRADGDLELDTTLTPALKEEGNFRELIRAVQDLRKHAGLTVLDTANMYVETDSAGKSFIESKKNEIMKTTGLKDIIFDTASGEATTIGDLHFVISFTK